MTNFNARIVRDIILDDGEEEWREFGVEAEVAGQKLTFSISAAEFGRMGWVLQKLGPKAIIYPGPLSQPAPFIRNSLDDHFTRRTRD